MPFACYLWSKNVHVSRANILGALKSLSIRCKVERYCVPGSSFSVTSKLSYYAGSLKSATRSTAKHTHDLHGPVVTSHP